MHGNYQTVIVFKPKFSLHANFVPHLRLFRYSRQMSDDSHSQQLMYQFSLAEKHLQIHGHIRGLGYKGGPFVFIGDLNSEASVGEN